MLNRLLSFRGFILGSIKREFVARYRQSVLGAAWSVLTPLATMAVYVLVFGQVMKARLPGDSDVRSYSAYLAAGFVAWTLFSEIVSRCQSVFGEQASLIKKLPFPRACLPAIVVGSALVNFVIFSVVAVAVLAFAGRPVGWQIVLLPPVVMIECLLAVGIGVAAGILSVFVRDVGHFVGVMLQFWFWLTPVVYPMSILPDSLQSLAWLNPMVSVAAMYQAAFIGHAIPSPTTLLYPLIAALAACTFAVWIYRRNADELTDYL